MKIHRALCGTLLMLVPALLPAQSGGQSGQSDGQGGGVGPPAATPRPNPDATGNYHIGDGVTPPILFSSVEPKFSNRARKEKVSGICLLSMLVDINGNPQDVTIIRSVADSVSAKHQAAARELDQKALEAVRQYRFKPAMFAGNAVPLTMRVQVSFQIY